MDKGLSADAIFDPYDLMIWIANVISLIVLCIMVFIVVRVYRKLSPIDLIPKLDVKFFMVRLGFGFTEPDKIGGFASHSYKSGKM